MSQPGPHESTGNTIIAKTTNLRKWSTPPEGKRDVVCAANGREAKNILSKRCFDDVLTDLWMPELDGFGLAREIAGDKTLKDISVYAVTADISAQKDCMEAGFTGVLFKPVTLDRLVQLFGVAK